MSSSDSDSSSAYVKPSKMYDNEQVIRQRYSTFRVTAVDNERPTTSREDNATMTMVNGQGNEFDKVTKQKLHINGKCDKRAKRLRSTLADPSQVGRNSDVTIDIDFTESGIGEDRLLEENTERVIQTTLFDDNETYQTTSAVRKTLHGTVYQWKHMMLVVHRAREKGYSFRFATEMDAAEKFDDAVLEYQDPVRERVHRFLQFKHVSVDGMVKAHDLLTTAKKDPFSIVKYFNSWRKIRDNSLFEVSRSKEFFLCTNLGLDVAELEAKGIEVKELAMDDLLKVTVGPKQTPRFYKLVDEPSILRDKLRKETGASEKEASEFLEEFILAVNQPNEIELGTMIKHELGASHQFNLLNVHFIGACFQNMMVNLLKQTGRHSEFLSHQEADAFFEEMQRQLSSLITVGLKLSYSAELENYDIKFKFENSDLREYVDSSHTVRNSVLELTSSNPTLLTALRVYQTLKQIETYTKKDSLIFIHLEKLLLPDITDQVLCAFGSSISHDLLVIDCGLSSHREHTQTLWSRLRDILEEIPRKKLILIIQEHESSAVRKIRQRRDDEISIIDLAECSRQKLLKKSIIKFQGHAEKTSFSEILGIHDFDNIESNELSAINQIIKKEALIRLIRGEEIVIGSEIQGLGDVQKYDIPRTIVQHVVIGAEILKFSKIPDLFAIGGIDQEALEKLVATENRNQSLDKSSLKKSRDLDKWYILQTGQEADHFRNICERNLKRNIHWLQGESGALIWQQSFGSITNLLAFRNTSMDHDHHERPGATILTENQLAQHDEKRRIVILTDTAGMGKSTLLTHLAEKMKRDQSSLLVIRVDLTQHTGVLEEEKKKRTFERDDKNGAVNFLVDRLSNFSTDFERNISREIVKVTGETAVLIDGYDEICPDYGDIVIDLLRSLAELPIKRLFVSTRPHTSSALEEELVTFSYVLQPFSRANQMEFLTKFWGRSFNSNDFDDTIGENLVEHASAVLKILVKLINPQMLQFTGIPLQTRLVAEAFPYGDEEKLNQFDSSEKQIYITDLYRCFVDKKFDIFLKEKSSGDHTNLGQKKNRKVMYRSFLMTHQKLALEALFDERTVTALMKSQQEDTSSSSQNNEDQDEGEERSGIITQVINGKPHFVHRTYAEYFAASFLSKKLKDNGCDTQVQIFFVAELLVKPRYEAIRAFLNCFLCRRDHAPEKYSWASDLREHCDAIGQTLYHVAAREHNTGIARFFSIRIGISLAAKSPKQDPDINFENKRKRTPLMVAASERVLALVECLVEGGADINRESEDGFTALDWALVGRSRLDFGKYLFKNSDGINHQLHSANAELDVVKDLLKIGAQINRESKYHLKSLHSELESSAALDVVKYLIKNGAEINHKSKDGSTALHWALRARDQFDAVKYLVENGAEINHESKYGQTALRLAIYCNAKLNVVQYLVESGAEINFKSKNGLTLLQLALACGTELNVIQYLVENGAAINSEGSMRLDLADYKRIRPEVMEYLINKDVKFDRDSEDHSDVTGM